MLAIGTAGGRGVDVNARGRIARMGDRLTSRMRDVPARFMSARLVLGVTVFVLLVFGLVMIYSASSVVALTSADTDHNPLYYVQRQAIFVAVGVAFALAVMCIDYHVWSHRAVALLLWGLTVAALLVIFTPIAGHDAYGASRWVMIGGFTLQPSEFAKITVILTAATIATRYFERGEVEFDDFVKQMAVGAGVPVALIVLQPDKGTVLICVGTLLVMGYLAGIPRHVLRIALVAAGVVLLALILKDDYSRRRFLTTYNPWADPFGDGYQLIQGFYAFGGGGPLGVGMAMSRQKYSYLPFAHNDFIYAVIGEEWGLVGTVFVLLLFALLAWAGFRVARFAPDLSGRLIAAGCTSMLVIQLLVNVGGVLGIIPLSGKPLPFLSYGGSSVISCLILVGMIGSVSRASRLPETEFDRRRGGVRLADDPVAHDAPALSLVGEPTPRSQRHDAPARSAGGSTPLAGSRRTLTVYRGGLADEADLDDANPTSPASIRARQRLAERAGGRVSVDASGRRRIDLGPDAATRLRGRR